MPDRMSKERVLELAEGITPGPWVERGFGSVMAGTRTVAEVDIPDDGAAIAAAPDLLATVLDLYAEAETARGIVRRLRAGWVPAKFTGHGQRWRWVPTGPPHYADEPMSPSEVAYLAADEEGT